MDLCSRLKLRHRGDAMTDREKLATWMIKFSFATGHGDTMEQLLDALGTEIIDRIKIAGWLWKQLKDTEIHTR